MSEIKRGEIYYIESYYTTGSEQRAGRPAVIVSNERNNEYSSTVEVVYLTTQPKHDLPTHVTVRGTGRESIALCEQITSVSTERVGECCGECNSQELSRIDTALMISLDLMVENTTETPEAKQDNDEVAELRKRLTGANAQLEILQKMYNDLIVKAIK